MKFLKLFIRNLIIVAILYGILVGAILLAEKNPAPFWVIFISIIVGAITWSDLEDSKND